jgi:acyl-CoA thioester hydrolase
MRHVNNVSTIGLYEDGWARFVEDQGLGADDGVRWRIDYLGIDFRKELYYRDDVRVGTRLAGTGAGTAWVKQTLFRDDIAVGGAERIATPVDRRTGKPVGLPENIMAGSAANPGPAPFRPSPGVSPLDPDADYPLWREDTLRFADLDADERIGRLAQFELIESGRISVIQAAGPPTEDPDVIWMAVHVALNFLSPPEYPGTARTGTRVDGFGRSSCRVRQTIFSGGKPVASGGAVVALANRKTFATVEIPESTRDHLTGATEHGETPRERYDPARRFRG